MSPMNHPAEQDDAVPGEIDPVRRGSDPNVPGPQATAADKVETLIHYMASYPVMALVETGLYQGHGSGMELVRRGLLPQECYYVIDHQAENCRLAHAQFPQANFYWDDSATGIRDALRDLGDTPALFWLDAHGVPSDEDFPPCPLMEELRSIGSHRSDHVVLIDDLRLMGYHDWPTIEELRAAVDPYWQREELNDIMRLVPR